MLSPFGVWLETVGRLGASTSRGGAAVLTALGRHCPPTVAAVRTEDWRFVALPVSPRAPRGSLEFRPRPAPPRQHVDVRSSSSG